MVVYRSNKQPGWEGVEVCRSVSCTHAFPSSFRRSSGRCGLGGDLVETLTTASYSRWEGEVLSSKFEGGIEHVRYHYEDP